MSARSIVDGPRVRGWARARATMGSIGVREACTGVHCLGGKGREVRGEWEGVARGLGGLQGKGRKVPGGRPADRNRHKRSLAGVRRRITRAGLPAHPKPCPLPVCRAQGAVPGTGRGHGAEQPHVQKVSREAQGWLGDGGGLVGCAPRATQPRAHPRRCSPAPAFAISPGSPVHPQQNAFPPPNPPRLPPLPELHKVHFRHRERRSGAGRAAVEGAAAAELPVRALGRERQAQARQGQARARTRGAAAGEARLGGVCFERGRGPRADVACGPARPGRLPAVRLVFGQ